MGRKAIEKGLGAVSPNVTYRRSSCIYEGYGRKQRRRYYGIVFLVIQLCNKDASINQPFYAWAYLWLQTHSDFPLSEVGIPPQLR